MGEVRRKTRVSISICPTELECGSEGCMYDEGGLLNAIRRYVTDRYEGVDIECLQVGRRHGDGWWKVNGDICAGADLMAAFFDDHGADEELFESTEVSDG